MKGAIADVTMVAKISLETHTFLALAVANQSLYPGLNLIT